MRGLMGTVIGLGGGALWLLLLEATDFNGVTVGMGVLIGLAAIDRTKEMHHEPPS